MNIPYPNKKSFSNSYHHPQQQDESILGMSYQAPSVHPMNFNNSFKQQFKNEQQYGTPVSDSGSNFASSYSSNTSSSFSSASSLALSNLGSSFTSALSTSTMGSPPNFYYGSSPNPSQQNLSSLNNSYTKTNIFTPNNDNNIQKPTTFGTSKSGTSQIRPIVHSRPMSWDDVGEYARQSYSTSSSSNSGLFMNELSSSMDDLTLASFGSSQFGSSLTSSSYANSFNDSKIDNANILNMSSSNNSNPNIDNMFVRSVVDKVLSDESTQECDEPEQLHSNTFQPRPSSQYHQRATSMDRFLHPQNQQQTFKNTTTVNRRTLSQSCPTGMAQMNGVGYQLFQQQSLPSNNIPQDEPVSEQSCRFYYSQEGQVGENSPFIHSNTLIVPQSNSNNLNSQTRVQQQPQAQVSKSKSRYQTDTFSVINFGSSTPLPPSPSQPTPLASGTPSMVGDAQLLVQPNSNSGSSIPTNNSNQTAQQVCQFFKKGECKFGDKCRNVHLKNKSKIDEQSRKKLKNIRCRFGVNCPFGHECYYYHTDSDFDYTPSNNN